MCVYLNRMDVLTMMMMMIVVLTHRTWIYILKIVWLVGDIQYRYYSKFLEEMKKLEEVVCCFFRFRSFLCVPFDSVIFLYLPHTSYIDRYRYSILINEEFFWRVRIDRIRT